VERGRQSCYCSIAKEPEVAMKLQAHQATIQTASVQIKALTIRKKQVTLSTFRQLDVQEIIDLQNLEMRGLPWGRINYHSDKCEKTPNDHYHILWQKDNNLFRDKVSFEDPGERDPFGIMQRRNLCREAAAFSNAFKEISIDNCSEDLWNQITIARPWVKEYRQKRKEDYDSILNRPLDIEMLSDFIQRASERHERFLKWWKLMEALEKLDLIFLAT
jgi:hypothetical protein